MNILKKINQRRKVNAHMFSTGKIIFDKTGELKQLVKDSKQYLIKEYSKQNETLVELEKYRIWDMCDNLEEVFEVDAEEFFFVFYNYLNDLFEIYAKFLQFDSVSVHKLKRFLVNEKDKKKYHVSNFSDEEFVKMYVNAINIKNNTEMMKEYQKLTNHVLNKMGGFNIDGWKVKSLI